MIKTYPHCDSRILHSKQAGCVYCNNHPSWQELRIAWNMNFTDTNDPKKTPCPAVLARPDTHGHWHGNMIMTKEILAEENAMWEEIRKEELKLRRPAPGRF